MLTEMTTNIKQLHSIVFYTHHTSCMLVTVIVFTDNNTCAVVFIKTIGGGGVVAKGGVFTR